LYVKNVTTNSGVFTIEPLAVDWHRYSSPCSNVRYLGYSKNLCLLNYLFIL